MYNMIDYLLWRGDVPFINDFNEIDNIILARISYFPWDKLITKKTSIKDAFDNHKKAELKDEDLKLFELLSSSNRYKDLYITYPINKFSKEEEVQFFAITILLPNNEMYISYRGTDNTSVGLKEDFNMSFSDNVPSQIYAKTYLNEVGNIYKERKIYVGGHSKGGNIAVYASMKARPSIKSRILKIYNNDGPGFQKSIIVTPEYKSIIKKVITYVPQTSIVGRLLNHEEGYEIIKSNAKGIKEHSLYTWEVMGSSFINSPSLTKESIQIEKVINDFLKTTTKEERERVIDIFYEVVMSANLTSFNEMNLDTIKKIKDALNSYQNISKEDKQLLSKVFTYIFTIVKDNFLKETIKIKKENRK